MLYILGLQLVLIPAMGVSSMLTARFVRRYELPRLTMGLAWLAPGLGMLTAGLLLDLWLRWFLVLAGALGTVTGLVGVGALLWSTRLTGLQPRVTPIDLSSNSSHFD